MTQEDITRDMVGIIEDFPLTMVWNGAGYDVTTSHQARTKPLVDGGFLDGYDFQISTTIKKVDQNNDLVPRFPNGIMPDVGARVSVGTQQYRVERRIMDTLQAVVTFDCMAVE